jgi:hypothetical protein
MIARLTIFAGLIFSSSLPANAQYYNAQYHSPSYFSSPGSSPVVVPPTVITPGEQNSSKRSCRESVIDLFLFSVRRTSGDCTQ